MLKTTPDSFIYVYSKEGFFVSPASAIIGSKGNDFISAKGFINFFYNFISSFIDDINLKSTTDNQLEDLRVKLNSRSLLLFKFTSKT